MKTAYVHQVILVSEERSIEAGQTRRRIFETVLTQEATEWDAEKLEASCVFSIQHGSNYDFGPKRDLLKEIVSLVDFTHGAGTYGNCEHVTRLRMLKILDPKWIKIGRMSLRIKSWTR